MDYITLALVLTRFATQRQLGYYVIILSSEVISGGFPTFLRFSFTIRVTYTAAFVQTLSGDDTLKYSLPRSLKQVKNSRN